MTAPDRIWVSPDVNDKPVPHVADWSGGGWSDKPAPQDVEYLLATPERERAVELARFVHDVAAGNLHAREAEQRARALLASLEDQQHSIGGGR